MPRRYEIETRGHVWKTLEDSDIIDVFGLDDGIHNGPICIKCGYSFCHHCKDLPSKDCPSAKKTS